MNSSIRIGIIGGAGWLGSCIADAILTSGVVTPDALTLSYRRSKPDRFAGVYWTDNNQNLVERSDVVILSIRPQDWNADILDAGGRLLISVMAGVQLSTLVAAHGSLKVVRAMPNAATEFRCSYTPWLKSDAVNVDDIAIVRAVLAACGEEDQVESEHQLDYLTGLSGTGPAYPALLAAAMMKGAIAHGLSPALAQRAVIATMTGAGRLLEERPECPDDIVDRFVDYHGVTAAGILQMRVSGFDTSVVRGLDAAFKRSVSMGEPS